MSGRTYVDTSAALKRILLEPDAREARSALDRCHDQGDELVSSALLWIELTRAVRAFRERHPGLVAPGDIGPLVEDASSGISEFPVNAQVVALARHVGPPLLRSLDAIHLATAIAVGADRILTFDERLRAAAQETGVLVVPTP